MLELTCRLSQLHNTKIESINLATIDEIALRYDLFLGDIAFTADNCDFSANWGWVPIVDFMACMNAIVIDLLNDVRLLHFEFTESDAKITFRNDGSMIRIASTYADGSCHVSLEEFARKVISETRRLREELLASYPELSANPVFDKLLPITSMLDDRLRND